VIILGGILSGAFTPTEASVVAAAYALMIGVMLREIRIASLGPILVKVGADTARLMFIIAAASLFGWILAREGVPQALADAFLTVSEQPWAILLMINLLLFVLGCFMEPLTVMVILVPIFLPLIAQLGIDPVHFGVVITLNLMIGLITPPIGMVMFVIIGLTSISIERFTRAVLPFLGALVLVLLLITYVPELVLFLPNLVMGAG
jgi:C4-dicarboxylate transporter DctM subunit